MLTLLTDIVQRTTPMQQSELVRRAVEAVRAVCEEPPIESEPKSESRREDRQTEIAVRRFLGQPHARLFPFLGRKVRTPAGLGTLLQVFADRCTVVLDSHVAQCARFSPGEIEPVSCEVEP
jgi:hypothetical protein